MGVDVPFDSTTGLKWESESDCGTGEYIVRKAVCKNKDAAHQRAFPSHTPQLRTRPAASESHTPNSVGALFARGERRSERHF
jgi:hypothetical protein